MRVLITTQPGSSHFFSLVPLAQALRERGDEVRFATARAFLPTIARAGFEGFPAGLDYLESHIEAAFPEASGLDIGELDAFVVQRIMWDQALGPMVDDLLATGGTMAAAVKLVRRIGGQPVAAAFVIELLFLKGRARLEGLPCHSLMKV